MRRRVDAINSRSRESEPHKNASGGLRCVRSLGKRSRNLRPTAKAVRTFVWRAYIFCRIREVLYRTDKRFIGYNSRADIKVHDSRFSTRSKWFFSPALSVFHITHWNYIGLHYTPSRFIFPAGLYSERFMRQKCCLTEIAPAKCKFLKSMISFRGTFFEMIF